MNGGWCPPPTDVLGAPGRRGGSSLQHGLLGETHLIPHVGLELKLERGTEDLVAHVHHCVLVTSGIQVVHCILDDIQPLMARGLQVVLSREVGPEGAGQAGMKAQITALGERHTTEGCG